MQSISLLNSCHRSFLGDVMSIVNALHTGGTRLSLMRTDSGSAVRCATSSTCEADCTVPLRNTNTLGDSFALA